MSDRWTARRIEHNGKLRSQSPRRYRVRLEATELALREQFRSLNPVDLLRHKRPARPRLEVCRASNVVATAEVPYTTWR